jgi:hypothetical protein
MECHSLKIGRWMEEVGLQVLPVPWFLREINYCADRHYTN